jgi:hypothetical protein
MILTFITLPSPKQLPAFQQFQDWAHAHYGVYLIQEFTEYTSGAWYTAVKPYHSGIFPFLSLDLFVLLRGAPCNLFFGHDLLPYHAIDHESIQINDSMQSEFDRILKENDSPKSHIRFQGFGNRIDIGLNALSTLYVDILESLTQKESDVVRCLREFQFTEFKDPSVIKTYGLQKKVADHLEKSPVSIHHSLRSSKFSLLAETATAMKNMMV